MIKEWYCQLPIREKHKGKDPCLCFQLPLSAFLPLKWSVCLVLKWGFTLSLGQRPSSILGYFLVSQARLSLRGYGPFLFDSWTQN